jgi:hypothetical protein
MTFSVRSIALLPWRPAAGQAEAWQPKPQTEEQVAEGLREAYHKIMEEEEAETENPTP